MWGPRFALSVIAGGVIALANFEGIERIVAALARPRARKATWVALLWVGARYVLLGLILYVILHHWHANVVALSLGLSAPVAAIFVECGFEVYEQLSSKEQLPAIVGQGDGNKASADPGSD